MSEVAVSNPIQYTANETMGLLVGSFRYSRGAPEVQVRIFEFFAAEYGDRFNLKTLHSIAPKLAAVAAKFVFESGIHPGIDYEEDSPLDAVKVEVDSQIEELHECLSRENRESVMTPAHLLDSFAETCTADAIRIPFGSIRAPSYAMKTPLRYRSNVVDHGFFERKTGLAEIDNYFTAIAGAYFKAQDFSKPEFVERAGSEVAIIASAHLAWNPEDAAALSAVISSK